MEEKAFAEIRELLDGVETPKFFFCILEKTIFEDLTEQVKQHECFKEFMDLFQILTNRHEFYN